MFKTLSTKFSFDFFIIKKKKRLTNTLLIMHHTVADIRLSDIKCF